MKKILLFFMLLILHLFKISSHLVYNELVFKSMGEKTDYNLISEKLNYHEYLIPGFILSFKYTK